MQAAVVQQLIALNREFYQTHAEAFSATRGRLQTGMLRTLETVPTTAQVLDLGCGNGGVAAHLAASGHRGSYVGLDFSDGLLAAARQRLAAYPDYSAQFAQADLSVDWAAGTVGDLAARQFDVVLAMAVLHHIPGRELRLAFLRQVRGLLAAGGRFVHSNWQFMRSPKLAARVQPWAAISLDQTQVDPGDYLLDWRSGGVGLRYVHQFSEEELVDLAEDSGFRLHEVFYSDGHGDKLALYQCWKPEIVL